jgi:hypothetical protein
MGNTELLDRDVEQRKPASTGHTPIDLEQIRTLKAFYDLMAQTRELRFVLVNDLYTGGTVDAADIGSLENAFRSLEGIPRLRRPLPAGAQGSDALKDFDKADPVNYLAQEPGLDMARGPHLVCGDTGSDAPMIDATVAYSKDTYAIFVTIDDKLRDRVLAASHHPILASQIGTYSGLRRRNEERAVGRSECRLEDRAPGWTRGEAFNRTRLQCLP